LEIVRERGNEFQMAGKWRGLGVKREKRGRDGGFDWGRRSRRREGARMGMVWWDCSRQGLELVRLEYP
jgi:hypothetical protein